MEQPTKSNPIGPKPFDTFVILSSNDHSLLFFTQSFAQLSGFHPSIVPSLIPIPTIWVQNLEIQRRVPLDRYEIYQFRQRTSLCNENLWVEDLIHELRTASLAIDLGAHVLAENDQLAPFLLRKLLRASHRQKISTLIASDFLQLLISPPSIYSISLTKILISGLSHCPTAFIKLYLTTSIETNFIGHINPVIWGNFHFLANFFATLLSWLKTEQVTLNIEVINPVSVLVTLDISPAHSLSNIQGFSLIPHYLNYITAYFNGRSWMTQNSIKILFPLDLSVLNAENNLKSPKT